MKKERKLLIIKKVIVGNNILHLIIVLEALLIKLNIWKSRAWIILDLLKENKFRLMN